MVRLFAVVAAWVGLAMAATACPFCNAQGTTLGKDFRSADFIIVANVETSTRGPDVTKSSSTLNVLKILKPHPAYENAKSLTVNRFITKGPTDKPTQYIMFCYVYSDPTDAAMSTVLSTAVFAQFRNATLDIYRGDDIPENSGMPAYLEATQKLLDRPAEERLPFYFEHLESNDLFISSDAYSEWGYTDYADVRKIAAKLPAATLVKWLRDPATLESRLGLYGLLLGHCGTTADTEELRKILDDPKSRYGAGLDGLLAGYVLLDKAKGWEYVDALATNPKKDQLIRLAALRAIRFFHTDRTDVIPAEQQRALLGKMLAQDDIADMVIDDIRKAGHWELTADVLSYADKESHNIGIVKRSMLKFALMAEAEAKNAGAVAYVKKARETNLKRVLQLEELLRDEDGKPAKK